MVDSRHSRNEVAPTFWPRLTGLHPIVELRLLQMSKKRIGLMQSNNDERLINRQHINGVHQQLLSYDAGKLVRAELFNTLSVRLSMCVCGGSSPFTMLAMPPVSTTPAATSAMSMLTLMSVLVLMPT